MADGRPILVFGRDGQVGRELCRLDPAGLVALGRSDVDITDREAVDRAVAASGCRLVVNAAAYTAVDRAEQEPDLAFAVNRDGPSYLAAACRRAGARLIHLSTDYVFDGTKPGPYREDDPVNPLGVYGRSKLAGEEAVRAASDDNIILRTAWVYAPHGQNFVRTMLRLGRERERLRIVADQQGCPTAAAELARVILAMAARLLAAPDAAVPGTFHACGSGSTSWYGFAAAIFEESARLGHPVPVLEPIATADYPTPARRPLNSRLDCSRLAQAYGLRLADWRDSLRECLMRIHRPCSEGVS